MADLGVPDEVARELARTAVAKAAEVASKAAVDAATFSADIKEARRDIERLDASFSGFRTDYATDRKESAQERKTQFRWVISLLATIVIAMLGMGFSLYLHK